MKRSLSRRAAFTLIELLVVIAIIAVLASILLAALFKIYDIGKDLQNRNDITQIHQAIAGFKARFAIDYMPSSISLPPADANSRSYLTRLWPRASDNISQGAVNWGVNGQLQGDQCLVFFLAGINQQGFSTDPTNPGNMNTPDKIGPFYEFKPNRVVMRGNAPSYQDVYGTPIAYFSTIGSQPNSYNPGDCAGIGACVYGQPGAYINPDTFQLISAGKNLRFGMNGAQWQPGMGATVYPPGSDGADDVTNFWDKRLGIN